MGYYTKASDWEVSGIGCLAGGAGAAGGWFFFLFRSQSANVGLGCRFAGAGFGGGADLGKIGKSVKLLKNAPKLEKLFEVVSYGAYSPTISFSPLEIEEAFSMNDLHHSPGRLTMAGAALGYGYTLSYITAATGRFSSYFYSQPCHGWGLGAGIVGMATMGVWFNRA